MLIKKLGHYFSNTIIIWLAILLYNFNRYYTNYLSNETKTTLLILALTYTIIGLFYYIIMPLEKVKKTKGTVLFNSIKKVLKDFNKYIKNFSNDESHPLPKISSEEKTNMLFLLVKIFFLPLMINFFFNNFNSLQNQIPRLNDLNVVFSVYGFNVLLFPVILSIIFLVDTLYFAFGYSVEAGFLKNKIRSVEPTAFGWIVALLTYPPFNDLTSNYLGWYANESVKFGGDISTMIFRMIIILLFLVYVSASIALGAKCSNLTNRGIVHRGPYAYVRHPAYISKNAAWWLMAIPLIFIGTFSITRTAVIILTTLTWSLLYYFRAITEERHLIKDPDYQKYVKKVKYRFIPKVF